MKIMDDIDEIFEKLLSDITNDPDDFFALREAKMRVMRICINLLEK
jgi:hypothetical protein